MKEEGERHTANLPEGKGENEKLCVASTVIYL